MHDEKNACEHFSFHLQFQVSLEDFLESCGGVATSSVGGARTTGAPTLLAELEDDEDGVLEEEEDNEENDQEVSVRISLFTVFSHCCSVDKTSLLLIKYYCRRKTKRMRRKATVVRASMRK